MSIFDPLFEVINFIGQVFGIIFDGIYGIISIIESIFELVLSICRIIPNPLYPCFMTFLYVYLTIFTYKIIRKG